MSLTLGEMTTFICNKVGQFDTVSQTRCKEYLRSRYIMIFDSFFWADSALIATANLAADVATFPYPDGMERVKTIRCNGTYFLDPIDTTFLIESDPTIFERSGKPIYYDEDTTTPNTYRITVYPTPDTDTTFLIYGKRICPALTDDGDVSILRNCDNAIIAFAMGDMLERQRQYGKAQAKFQEAAEHLKGAKALETEQANQPRRTKNLTVAGNSLLEMTDAVCGICGQWTPDVRILVKESLRRNYQWIYDMQLWPEATVMVRMQLRGQQAILPHYIDRVMAVRGGDLTALWPTEQTETFNIDPGVFYEEGVAYNYYMLTPVGVSLFPPFGMEYLSIASTSSADDSKVFVRGETSGHEVTEEVILNGTTPVKTAHAYDLPLTVAKGLTTGSVTVNADSSFALLLQLAPNERERKHLRIWLLPNPEAQPDDQNKAVILGKRRITPLLSDEDTPIITGCQNVLINMAAADTVLKLGDKERATVMQTKAAEALQILKTVNTDQSAYNPRFIPAVQPSPLSLSVY